ncbi:MAG: hypothetical protein FJ109_00595 [Deltaproteobacteria bacterium]|nr:hypothetical protein [Deltaproteobacteria bacterium]
MAPKPYKRKVSNMLVDSRFQLKYTLFLVAVSLAVFSVLGWFYYSERKTTTELLEIDARFSKLQQPQGAASDAAEEYARAFDADIEQDAAARDTKASVLMLAAVAGLVLVLMLAGIWLTHKAAGPLFALSKFMEAAQQGRWKEIRPFRKGDEFLYLAEQFQKLAARIQERHKQELLLLLEAARSLSEGKSDDAAKKLSGVIADKKSYLGSEGP